MKEGHFQFVTFFKLTYNYYASISFHASPGYGPRSVGKINQNLHAWQVLNFKSLLFAALKTYNLPTTCFMSSFEEPLIFILRRYFQVE